MKLLHIDSSIQGNLSASRQVTAAVVDKIKSADPALDLTYRDLVGTALPHLTLGDLADAQANVALQEFLAADIVVIGAGMYNLTISSQLKAWIDRILIAGQTFQYSEAGVQGLVGDKRVIIVLSRGGLFGTGSPFVALEHAETYLRDVFGFIGIVPELIVIEGVAISEESRKTALATAMEEALRVAPTGTIAA